MRLIAITALLLLASPTIATPDTIRSAPIPNYEAGAEMQARATIEATAAAKSGLPIALPWDPLGLNGTNADGSPIKTPLQQGAIDIINKLVTFVTKDVDSALALAKKYGDGNGAACWAAVQPLAGLVKDHPLIFTFQAASDLEAARVGVIQLGQLCTQQPSCKTVFSDAVTIAQRIATLAPVSVRPVIPNMWDDVCNAIPLISSTLTINTTAPATPDPTPSPTK